MLLVAWLAACDRRPPEQAPARNDPDLLALATEIIDADLPSPSFEASLNDERFQPDASDACFITHVTDGQRRQYLLSVEHEPIMLQLAIAADTDSAGERELLAATVIIDEQLYLLDRDASIQLDAAEERADGVLISGQFALNLRPMEQADAGQSGLRISDARFSSIYCADLAKAAAQVLPGPPSP